MTQTPVQRVGVERFGEMSEVKTIYVSKYALTLGILKLENANVTASGMASFRGKEPGSFMEYFHSGTWHHTEEEAVAAAEEMRGRKIASLKKSLAKMEALDFSKPKGASK